MMTMEEKLLRAMFAEPSTKKDIHNLTSEEVAKCNNNGYNSCIEIVVDDFVVTGGTLEERCTIAQSDINMKNVLQMTTVDEIITTTTEGEEVSLYIFEDLILVFSDIRYESNVERTFFLPLETLAIFEGLKGIEIIDLR